MGKRTEWGREHGGHRGEGHGGGKGGVRGGGIVLRHVAGGRGGVGRNGGN